ncbi:MAG: hypothetical protein KatS3mg032_0572 [Cyclobacteriaceae bacterium]|nr:MAG: hypothetical protein KatS3mg032_0572 [Cyclobacteriaceae bacterium]
MYTRFLPVMVLLLCAAHALAQHSYHRNKSRHYRDRYREQISYYADACDILQKKRSAVPRQHSRHRAASVRYRPMAEFGPPRKYRRSFGYTPSAASTRIASGSGASRTG